jgi:sulfur-oxidizing protein SoxX
MQGGDERGLHYGVIYNAHAYFPCTNMPRMGANNLLSNQQIADVMAYLFDPESPVNT